MWFAKYVLLQQKIRVQSFSLSGRNLNDQNYLPCSGAFQGEFIRDSSKCRATGRGAMLILKCFIVDSWGRMLIKGQLNNCSMSIKCEKNSVLLSSFTFTEMCFIVQYVLFKRRPTKLEFRAFEVQNLILLYNVLLV